MGLKTHQERTHGSGGNLNCKICNKTINGQLQTLRNHELVCDGRSSEAKSVFAINSECRLDKVQTKGLCNMDRKSSYRFYEICCVETFHRQAVFGTYRLKKFISSFT